MSEGRPDTEVLVAVVADGRVLVVGDPGGLQLPRVTGADGMPSTAEVLAVAGAADAVLAAPGRLVGGRSRLVLQLVSRSAPDPDRRWLGMDELDALDEPDGVRDTVARGVAEWGDPSVRPAGRPTWFTPGWSRAADAWIDEELGRLGRHRAGRSEPVKVWSLSAVLRVPTVGPADVGDAAVYFKATCDWFRSEPAFTEAIAARAPDHVPHVLALDHDRAWMLMDPIAGAGTETPAEQAVPAAIVLAGLQSACVHDLPRLRTAGLPDRTLEPTVRGIGAVVADSVELDLLSAQERSDVSAMSPWLVEVLHEFGSIGLPYSVGHGDLHVGNLAVDGDDLVIYDWTDAAITFPFLDAVHLAGSTGDHLRDRVLDAYARVWSAGYLRADVDRALTRAAVVNRIYQAISYEAIYRAQEADSRWEMRGAVAGSLRSLIESWRSSSASNRSPR